MKIGGGAPLEGVLAATGLGASRVKLKPEVPEDMGAAVTGVPKGVEMLLKPKPVAPVLGAGVLAAGLTSSSAIESSSFCILKPVLGAAGVGFQLDAGVDVPNNVEAAASGFFSSGFFSSVLASLPNLNALPAGVKLKPKPEVASSFFSSGFFSSVLAGSAGVEGANEKPVKPVVLSSQSLSCR